MTFSCWYQDYVWSFRMWYCVAW